jgi:hypothetical protein
MPNSGLVILTASPASLSTAGIGKALVYAFPTTASIDFDILLDAIDVADVTARSLPLPLRGV